MNRPLSPPSGMNLSRELITTAPRYPRLNDLELAMCLLANRGCRFGWIARPFALVSRLGDGVFWYTLMVLLLLVEGVEALPVVVRMLLAAGLGLAIYKMLKSRTIRPRPCDRNPLILLTVAPLDRYSFPSGHTLHAVCFTLVATAYYPLLAWLLVPFAALVALSRLVLGLHYPSDVLAGATLGAGFASLVLQF